MIRKTCWRGFTAAALLLASCAPAAADPTPPKSLDDQLLDDLDTELLPGVEKKPGSPSALPGKDTGLDEKLLEQLGDGEDIELGAQPDPLTRIGRTMRQVESRIGQHDTSASTQELQRRIVTDLEALLEQTKKQCQGGQCKTPSSSSSPSGAAGNKPSEGEAANKPAKDSTERLAKPGQTAVEEQQDLDALVKQVWGHLPDKLRGQMQNVSVENFLPKYERLIEEYYKRLAEAERGR